MPSRPNVGRDLLTTLEVSFQLNISVSSIRRLMEAGKFPAPVRLGRSLRWRAADIRAYLEALAPLPGSATAKRR